MVETWDEMFSTRFYEDFPSEENPLLIGVVRSFQLNKNGIITPEYQFQALFKGDVSMRTQLTVNGDNLLAELKNFKEKYHENEENPVSIF